MSEATSGEIIRLLDIAKALRAELRAANPKAPALELLLTPPGSLAREVLDANRAAAA